MAGLRRFLPLVLALGLLLLPLGGAATAAGGKLILYFVQSFVTAVKAGTKVTAKASRTQFDTLAKSVPGLKATAKALEKHADNQVEAKQLATALANEVIWRMSRQGVDHSVALSCGNCFGEILLAPDAFVRSDQAAVRMAMSDYRAGIAGQGPLRHLDAQGKPVFGRVSNNDAARRAARDAVADVLAADLAELRKARVSESEFAATATEKLAKQATDKPKSRYLKSITYNKEKGTLSFELDIGKTKVSVKELKIELYLKQLKAYLYGGGTAGSAGLLLRDDSSPEAESARKNRAQALLAECTKFKGQSSLTTKLPPPHCAESLSPIDKAAINREILTTAVCRRNTDICDI